MGHGVRGGAHDAYNATLCACDPGYYLRASSGGGNGSSSCASLPGGGGFGDWQVGSVGAMRNQSLYFGSVWQGSGCQTVEMVVASCPEPQVKPLTASTLEAEPEKEAPRSSSIR